MGMTEREPQSRLPRRRPEVRHSFVIYVIMTERWHWPKPAVLAATALFLSIDTAFLIDVLGAFVRILALDPHWLLTGEYDANSHRRVLELIEARGHAAERVVRQWLVEHVQRLRAGLKPLFAR